MKNNYLRYLRFALMLATLSFGLGAAKDAHAVNQMRLCGSFATAYRDIRAGQDYLVNATEPATRHWAIVIANGITIYNDYLIGNCTPLLGISGGFTEFWVTNHVEVDAGKYVAVYPDTSQQFLWHEKTFNTPINPIGNSEYFATFNGTVPAHVSLLATRIVPSQMVIPPGSSPFLVEYKTFADMNMLSQNSGGDVYIGRIAVNGVVEKDAFWRSVVGHELGHQVASRLFGNWSFNYNLNGSTNKACNCDDVEVAGDRAHCMNSREQLGAARSEAWAHSFSTSLVNNPADANANFGYYKRFHDPQAPGNHILYPPFSVDALVTWEWMEAYCNMANAGTEMDWMGFFYQLDNKTANAWSIGNFTSVFATECGTPPFGSCAVTYTTLQNATNTFFGVGSAKAAYMIAAADGNGINH